MKIGTGCKLIFLVTVRLGQGLGFSAGRTVLQRCGGGNFKGRSGHLSAEQDAVEGHGAVKYDHLAEGKKNTDFVLPALLQGS